MPALSPGHKLGMRGTALAIGEVLGRRVAERIPNAPQRVGRWVRRGAAKPQKVTLDQMMSALADLGLVSGRHVAIHSSWDNLGGLEEKPSRVLAALQELVGEQGTLLMPTGPLVSKAIDPPLYDVDKTPSSVGLLTEVLRRTPGAVRSPVPEAPVSAIGRDAGEYGVDFRETSGNTPYGKGSPWHRLAEHGGLVAYLGIGVMRSNTLQHAAFDLLGDQTPIADFYSQKTWRVVRSGREETWVIRRHRPDLQKYLATVVFGTLLDRTGLLKARTLGGIFLGVLDARGFLDWHLELARRTGLPYFGYLRRRAQDTRS